MPELSSQLAEEVKREARREIRRTLFPDVFHEAELRPHAVGAGDREDWLERYLDDPDELQLLASYNWVAVDAAEASRDRQRHLKRSLQPLS